MKSGDHRRVFPIWHRFWAAFANRDVTWFADGRIAASRFPGRRSIERARRRGVHRFVNLALRPNRYAALMQSAGIEEVHIPVPDLRPPAQEQLEHGVRVICESLEAGHPVLVHCAAGLGRTGTLLACYFTATGMTAEEAIRHVRDRRPGSIETYAQEAAVEAFAASR